MSEKLRKGFTLAEVLLTLAIIGIVAALTIPSLLNSVNKNNYISGLKKAYSSILTATNQLIEDNGGTMKNLISANNNHNEWLDKYCSILQCVKTCTIGTVNDNCFTNPVNIKILNGNPFTDFISAGTFNNFAGAVLSNGMTIVFDARGGNTCDRNLCTYNAVNAGCGTIFIDVNGFKSPNTLGRDIFLFYPYTKGLYPTGVAKTNASTLSGIAGSCDITSTNAANGYGCAGKILLEGTVNY